MWSCDQSLQFYERSYRKLFSEFDQKNTFFEGWSWFKFNNLGLALGIALEFFAGLAKGLKLKVRKLWGGNSYVRRSYRGKTGRGA